MRSIFSKFFLLVLAFASAGCNSKQIYESAQGWRVNECQKILDDGERARCAETANKDYDTYSRERSTPSRQY